MRLSGLPVQVNSNNSLTNLKKDLDEGGQKKLAQRFREEEVSAELLRESGNRANDELFQRAIEASAEASRLSRDENADRQKDLPLQTQRALQTFQQNVPSPEQRLGIQLAGVDTYA